MRVRRPAELIERRRLPATYCSDVTLRLVAFHYPKPEHRDELLQRMRAAAEVMRTVEGCSEASVWETRETAALVSTGTFASDEAWAEAVQAVVETGVDFEYDDRESRPRDLFFLMQPQ